MKSLLTIVLLSIAPLTALGIEEAEFDSLMSAIRAKNYPQVETFLDAHESTSRGDPEYFVVLLNFVIAKGQHSAMVIAKGEPQPGDHGLHDPETGEIVGFMGPRSSFDEALIVDGIRRTQAALPAFRNRLDIHFGIVSVAERIKRWDLVGDQLVEILETAQEIENRWTWGSINSMSGDPEDFMIQNVQAHTSTLFYTDDVSADDALVRVSHAMIEHYPRLVYGYANLGTLHLAKGQHEQARTRFLEALALAPNDEIVRGNLERLDQLQK